MVICSTSCTSHLYAIQDCEQSNSAGCWLKGSSNQKSSFQDIIIIVVEEEECVSSYSPRGESRIFRTYINSISSRVAAKFQQSLEQLP